MNHFNILNFTIHNCNVLFFYFVLFILSYCQRSSPCEDLKNSANLLRVFSANLV